MNAANYIDLACYYITPNNLNCSFSGYGSLHMHACVFPNFHHHYNTQQFQTISMLFEEARWVGLHIHEFMR